MLKPVDEHLMVAACQLQVEMTLTMIVRKRFSGDVIHDTPKLDEGKERLAKMNGGLAKMIRVSQTIRQSCTPVFEWDLPGGLQGGT